jgi:hypothetical protein
VTVIAGRTKTWFAVGICSSNTSIAMEASPGCATQVPSCPANTSRSLSARTLERALSFAAALSLRGITADMPPIAWTPRR